MKIAILYDYLAEGTGPDQADTLVQVDFVMRTLERLGHLPRRLPFCTDLKTIADILTEWKPDLAFNLVESVEGSGCLIHLSPSILDFLEIPYTGSPTDAVFITSNKLLTKKILMGAGIPTPGFLTVENDGQHEIFSGDPYIIKSVWEHASLGIDQTSVVLIKEPRQIFHEMMHRREKPGGEYFAERYIEGREFNISLLASEEGPEVLPPAEILFHDYPDGKWKIVDYKAKWDPLAFEYHHTRRHFEFSESDQVLLYRLAVTAKRCWQLLGLRGYARVDFRVDKDGEPWVLDINANPCLSPDAGFMAAVLRGGLDFGQVVERIVRAASRNHGPKSFTY